MKSEKFKRIIIKTFGFDETLFQATIFKRLLLLTFHFSLFACCVSAQHEQLPPDDVAPPALKMISKAEKSSLDAETDISERTKLSLALMEARLKNAENFYAQNSYRAMLDEFGGFSALIDNTLNFLRKNDDGRGKVLSNYKRLELNLRKFAPRIEMVRRELPLKYEYWVRSLIRDVRAARSKAVEPLFGNSVVPNNQEN